MPLTAKGNEILHNMEKEYGSPEKAKEVFYASKNKGTISGVDSMGIHDVPIGDCYKDAVPKEESERMLREHTNRSSEHFSKGEREMGEFHARAAQEHMKNLYGGHKDQSYPPMDPTSIGGMGPTEPSTAAPSGVDADPNRLRFASHEAVNPVEQRRAERERLANSTHGEEAARRAGPLGPESGEAGSGHDQHPGEPGHEAKEMSLLHQMENLHSVDALPRTLTQEQMSTMASMFNYNQKGSPY